VKSCILEGGVQLYFAILIGLPLLFCFSTPFYFYFCFFLFVLFFK
jgi:hypothetical protein